MGLEFGVKSLVPIFIWKRLSPAHPFEGDAIFDIVPSGDFAFGCTEMAFVSSTGSVEEDAIVEMLAKMAITTPPPPSVEPGATPEGPVNNAEGQKREVMFKTITPGCTAVGVTAAFPEVPAEDGWIADMLARMTMTNEPLQFELEAAT
jgi:hypothetical protein